MRAFEIAGKFLGRGSGCFVIAEAGVNHNGDVALAKQLIEVAARSGADAVKFQTFEPSRLATATAPMAEYQTRNDSRHASQLEMLEALALSEAAHEELRREAERQRILFLSSPFDELSADLLERLGVPAFKIASGEVTNTPFLRHIARKGKPMLVSTGMCTLEDVALALGVIRASGDPPVALFHCVSDYPANDADCNLRAMATMRQEFDVPVGWSDHTSGIHISIASAALGADLIEKHFTLDRQLPGPDHAASLEPDELRALVDGVRAVTSALGSGVKRPVESELRVARLVRKSLRWRQQLPAGTPVEEAHVIALRPADGMPPSSIESIVGKRLVRGVDALDMVNRDDVEGG